MMGQFTNLNCADPMRGATFDPVSLLAMGAGGGTLGTIGSIASVMAPVLSVAGAISDVNAGRQQAAEHERAGRESEYAANVQADMERRATRQRMASERAGQIEGGVYSGTALGLEEQNFLAAEHDALMIEYNGTQQRQSSEFRAAQARKSASPLRVFTAAIDGFSNFDPMNLSAGGGASLRGGVPRNSSSWTNFKGPQNPRNISAWKA